MPDLLLEFFSEEIPARMQAKAADDLRKLVTDALVEAGLVYEGAKAFATPRRLALSVHGVPARSPDVKEERKGPKVGAPEQAIAGFVKAAGLKSISEAKVQQDKKGDFYLAVTEKKGRPAIEVIAEIVPQVVLDFPWPKSMRWGDSKNHLERTNLVTTSGDRIVTASGDKIVVDVWLKWVRPLHSVIATFGPETEEPEIVPFEVGGVRSGNTTHGHRFMAPTAIIVKRFDDYVAKLEAAKVVLDPARRREIIHTDAKNLAFAQGYELVEDDGLLAEVAGLTEWPVALMGTFDKEFLAIPAEVIRATIRNNQKCFVLRDPQTAKLVNKFILVANEEASDGGKKIIAGNERVIRARLSDAKFFYDTDLKTKLEDRLPKFESIVFHEKLGTQGERIARIEALAAELAPLVKADVAKAKRAAKLAKADLLTEVVGEFPETQGLMGRYYAEAQGEDEAVAHAIEDHYKPQGPNDLVPGDPVSIAVALADKMDILAGFWTIEEKPTGSKDPYALRRAALGVIRIILDNNLTARIGVIGWKALLEHHIRKQIKARYEDIRSVHHAAENVGLSEVVGASLDAEFQKRNAKLRSYDPFTGKISQGDEEYLEASRQELRNRFLDLLSFFADRLKVQLREQGARHDLVDAVFALEGQDDLLLIVRRVEALGKFLDTDDGKNLLAGFKRANNILAIEEKKDKKTYSGTPDPGSYKLPEERALAAAVDAAQEDATNAVAREDFAAAMTAMARMRPAVDAFFDKVKVNDDDAKVRENRLKLLNQIREATRAVADFSKIEG